MRVAVLRVALVTDSSSTNATAMTTFFIGGCMRTGTTLLSSILCSDATTNPVIGEVQYLTHMMHHYH